jgi:hypothetical protein
MLNICLQLTHPPHLGQKVRRVGPQTPQGKSGKGGRRETASYIQEHWCRPQTRINRAPHPIVAMNTINSGASKEQNRKCLTGSGIAEFTMQQLSEALRWGKTVSPPTDTDTRTGNRSSSVGTMSLPSRSTHIPLARTPL